MTGFEDPIRHLTVAEVMTVDVVTVSTSLPKMRGVWTL
jgi:hypothetical protein